MTITRARLLRARATASERALWDVLRRRQQWGLRFRRQHPIGPFVVDFVCLQRRLIVEVDGDVHEHARQIARDIERDKWLSDQRFRIVRIPSGIASSDPEQACAMIAAALGADTVAGVVTPHPRPFPRKGGRERRTEGVTGAEASSGSRPIGVSRIVDAGPQASRRVSIVPDRSDRSAMVLHESPAWSNELSSRAKSEVTLARDDMEHRSFHANSKEY